MTFFYIGCGLMAGGSSLVLLAPQVGHPFVRRTRRRSRLMMASGSVLVFGGLIAGILGVVT